MRFAASKGPIMFGGGGVAWIRTESARDLIFGGRILATHVVFDYLQLLVDGGRARGSLRPWHQRRRN